MLEWVELQMVLTNDFWEYNPTTNSWSQKEIFPGSNRDKAVGFSINDKGYVGTGSSSTSIGNETRRILAV